MPSLTFRGSHHGVASQRVQEPDPRSSVIPKMEIASVGSLLSKTWVTGILMALLVIVAVVLWQRSSWGVATRQQSYPVSHTDREWRERLTSPVYRVLRQAGTELSNSSPLNSEQRKGAFVRAGCEAPLFDSADKFESGTGWPSFVRPAPDGMVATRTDYKIGFPRTEVHCSDCGGHLGHVFNDGPAPTGQRYCMNGLALKFVSHDAMAETGSSSVTSP